MDTHRDGVPPNVFVIFGGTGDLSRRKLLPALTRMAGARTHVLGVARDASHTDESFRKLAYDAAVANYRQTVLTAFREVEDNLSTLRILGDEAAVQQQALAAARQSVDLTTNQYKAGLVGFLNVVVVQAQAFAAERNAIDLAGRRLSASVALIKALGGPYKAPA